MEEIGKMAGAVLVFITVWVGKNVKLKYNAIKKRKEAEKKKLDDENKKIETFNGYDKTNNILIEIKYILEEIKGLTGCGRVDLFVYNNTVKTVDGICLMYVSIISEALGRVTQGIKDQFQNRLISDDMRFMINKISNSESGWLKVDAVDEKGDLLKMQRVYGTVKSYNFKIGKSVWEGVLSVSWVSNDNKTVVEDLEQDKINQILVYIEDIKSLKEKLTN